MKKYMLGAYWPGRSDNLDQCVDSAERFFAELGRCDPAFSHWYEGGRFQKENLSKEVDVLDRTKVRDLLIEGQNRKDNCGEVIDSLGFNIGLWNGSSREGKDASLYIRCGSYNERISDSVTIDLPIELAFHNASALLALVAKTWRPAWAGIMSKRAMRERDFSARNPFVDWMVYVPRALPTPPSPSVIEAVDTQGSIVIVQPSPPDGNDANELHYIRQVEALLVT